MSGRVVDHNNTSVADAEVSIHRYSGDSGVAKTDADGAFLFTGLILAQDVQFSARKGKLVSPQTDLIVNAVTVAGIQQ